jgi:hypothetical protein
MMQNTSREDVGKYFINPEERVSSKDDKLLEKEVPDVQKSTYTLMHHKMDHTEILNEVSKEFFAGFKTHLNEVINEQIYKPVTEPKPKPVPPKIHISSVHHLEKEEEHPDYFKYWILSGVSGLILLIAILYSFFK